MLLELPNVLSPEEVRDLLAALDGGTFVDGRVTADNEAALAKRNLQLSATAPLRHELSQRIKKRLVNHQVFQHAALPKALTDFHFSVTSPG